MAAPQVKQPLLLLENLIAARAYGRSPAILRTDLVWERIFHWFLSIRCLNGDSNKIEIKPKLPDRLRQGLSVSEQVGFDLLDSFTLRSRWLGEGSLEV